MHKQSLNTKGFGLTGVLAVALVLVVVVGGGALVYRNNHKTKPVVNQASSTKKTTVTTTTDPYAGWQTLALASSKLTLKYPAGWTLNDEPLCDGNGHNYNLKAPTGELASAGGTVSSYTVTVVPNAGVTTNGCNAGSSVMNVLLGAQSNAQAITSGGLKGNYVVVGADTNGTTETFVLNKNYSAGQKIEDQGYITATNGEALQVTASFMNGQDIGQANSSDFLSSQLYKDTMNIVDSFAAN